MGNGTDDIFQNIMTGGGIGGPGASAPDWSAVPDPSGGTDPTAATMKQQPRMNEFIKILQALQKPVGKVAQIFGAGKGGQLQQTPGQPGQQIPGAAPAARMGQPFQPGTAPGSGLGPPMAGTPPRPGFQQTGTEGQFMSQLTPQASGLYQGLQSLHQILSDKQQRQDQTDAAEAANVAQNLMKAIDVANNSQDPAARGEAMQTVDMILKNKEYEKVLNKVYKGWLQKADAQQKQKGKQKAPDPETAGFESGLQKYLQGKQAAPPQMPRNLAGYRLPSAGPAQQIQQTQQQALLQAMQKDPETAAYGPEAAVKLQEARIHLQEAQQGVETAKARSAEAASAAQKAQLEYDTAKAMGPVKEKEWETKLEIEGLRADKALLDLDKANALLQIAKEKLANPKEPPATAYTKMRGLSELSRNLDAMISNPPSWRFGSAPQSMRELAGNLRIYGMAGAASKIPTGTSNFFVDTKEILESIKGDLDSFKDSYIQGLQEQYKGWNPPGSTPSAAPPSGATVPPGSTAGAGATPVDTKNWQPYTGKGEPPDIVWQAKPPKATQMAPTKDGIYWWVDDNGTPVARVTAPPSTPAPGGK